MANRLPHLALRINKDPANAATDVVATINLALDDPRNYGRGSRFVTLECLEQIVPVFQITEGASSTSTRRRLLKGSGDVLRMSIAAYWQTGNKPLIASQQEGEYGSFEEDIDTLANALSAGMSVSNDGNSRYLWVSPNYNWNEPAEQWIRVVPEPNGFKSDYMQSMGVQIRGMQLSVLSADNAKSITRTNYRRGFVYAGTGTLSTTSGSKNVTGSSSRFKRDYIHLDFVRKPDGTLLGRVDTVTSDTALVLMDNAPATYSGAHQVHQRSAQTLSVPVYTLTSY